MELFSFDKFNMNKYIHGLDMGSGPLLNSVYDGTATFAAYNNYNALGQPGTITYGNGVTTDYAYNNSSNSICPDDNYRLCTINTSINGVTLQDLRYSYDDTGNVTGINDSTPVSQEMENDRLARLTSLGDMTYTYPDNGTRPHAVASAGGNTYTYDYNGNMTSGAGRSITYNHENMPISITANGITTNIDYDGFGNRVRKTLRVNDTATSETTYIGNLYECVNGSCTKYVFANGQRIAARTATGAVYYFHSDRLGSSSVITASSGLNVENLAYYPYGQTEVDTGSANVPYKYTGQELDTETGLYNYNARYYDPVLGRFISADSIVPNPADPQSLNRYSYVNNNPINYTDPSGHCDADLCYYEDYYYNDYDYYYGEGGCYGSCDPTDYNDDGPPTGGGGRDGGGSGGSNSNLNNTNNNGYYAGSSYHLDYNNLFMGSNKYGYLNGSYSLYDVESSSSESGGWKNRSYNLVDSVKSTLGSYLPDLEGARRIAKDVRHREAPATGLPGVHNGLQDAWRHARWNQRMVEELGWGTAIIAGYGHELEEIFSQPFTEFLMDLHNNREGRRIANTGNTPQDLLNEKRLRIIDPPYPGEGGLY